MSQVTVAETVFLLPSRVRRYSNDPGERAKQYQEDHADVQARLSRISLEELHELHHLLREKLGSIWGCKPIQAEPAPRPVFSLDRDERERILREMREEWAREDAEEHTREIEKGQEKSLEWMKR